MISKTDLNKIYEWGLKTKFPLKLAPTTKGYTNKEHSVQKIINDYVCEISESENIHYEIDGCSAPTPFFTLETIAKMFQKLASGHKVELKRVFNAMASHPLMVGGTDNFDSIFIKVLKGRGVTKVGGESVRGISLNTDKYGPIGVSIKILGWPLLKVKSQHLTLFQKMV